jgi:CDP-glucose 4,6-dehydratase
MDLELFFSGKKVLVTGHTGFKGSWLTLWLTEMGAEVCGISLDPEPTSHWNELNLSIRDIRVDITDREKFEREIKAFQPEIVFHLAAQPLVRHSYKFPVETIQTNVLGTVYLLDVLKDLDSTESVLVITTDKCYENKEWLWGYRENERLGGHDPYSSSKACVELVTQCYRDSFFKENKIGLATARAGNVIGGGDWNTDRLIPDIMRSIQEGKKLEIRSPQATRPWQHVLDCIHGYLLLAMQLYLDKEGFSSAWNFGPGQASNRSVQQVLDKMIEYMNFDWNMSDKIHPHEATFLYLDSSKAKKFLGWNPVLNFSETIEYTARWYGAYLDKKNIITREQLRAYCSRLSDAME